MTLERNADRAFVRRVHQLDPRLGAERTEHVEIRAAHPQALECVVRARHFDELRGRVVRLHVDRALECRAELLVDVGHPRDRQLRELGGGGVGDAAPAPTCPHDGIVRTHDFTVGREPDVGLEAADAGCERARECGNRVLGLVEPGPAVGERDGHVTAHSPSQTASSGPGSRGARRQIMTKVPYP